MTKQEDDVNSPTEEEEAMASSLLKEAHVRAALAADKGVAVRLTAWKVVDFSKKGDNYVSAVSSVEVTYELDGQSQEVSYIVKLNPCRNSESSKEYDTIFFHNESSFYLDIVTDMNSILSDIGFNELKVPKCFHVDLEKYKEIIFLEDLRVQGFKMADRRQGLDEAHVRLVLEELAKFHSASFLMQAKAPGEDLAFRYPFLQRCWPYILKNNSLALTLFKGNLKYCRELLLKVGGYERAIKWIDSVIPSLIDVIDEQTKRGRFKVVCHGDVWSNNTLFRYGEGGRPVEVMLLDHQLSNHSSPAFDLNFLLYTSTTGEVRQPNLDAFLSTYYDTLVKVLKQGKLEPPFTQAQLLQEFRDMSGAGAIFAMVCIPLVIVEPENALDINACTDDGVDEMLQDSQTKSLEAQVKDPLIRQRFLSMFDDMMEAGLFP